MNFSCSLKQNYADLDRNWNNLFMAIWQVTVGLAVFMFQLYRKPFKVSFNELFASSVVNQSPIL